MRYSLNDYSKSAAQKGWGAGWPTCTAKTMTAVVVAPISGVAVTVHRRIARLVYLVIALTEFMGYLLRAGQTWGGNCRAIAGTKVSSNHAWWIAVDINSLANPYVKKGIRVTDMPDWMTALWAAFGFAWGGLYGDSMHYEFMGSPEDADDMTALAEQRLIPKIQAYQQGGAWVITDMEEDDMTPDQATALGESRWLLGQIKPNTDLLQAENAQTDVIVWAVNDIRQSLGTLFGMIGGLTTAVQQLQGGGQVNQAEILRVASERADAAVAESSRELAGHLEHMAELREKASTAIAQAPPADTAPLTTA